MKTLPEIKRMSRSDITALLARLVAGQLTAEDIETIRQAFNALIFITDLVARKDAQLKTLLKRIFGIKSETSQKIRRQLKMKSGTETKDAATEPVADSNRAETQAGEDPNPQDPPRKTKRKGHGRNHVEAYTGAAQQVIAHQELKAKDLCPECQQGRVYEQADPGVFIGFSGSPAIAATVYRQQKLRCNLCEHIFTAELPDSVKDQATEVSGQRHFEPSAKSMMAILRYGCGMPLYRLSRLQANLGIPVAVSTLWDKIKEASASVICILETLRQLAAQGHIIHHDDTGMKILAVMKQIDQEKERALETGKGKGKDRIRTGLFTTGIVVSHQTHKIALFFTGRKHAGENLSALLAKRDPTRSPPLTMSDAKSGCIPDNVKTITSYCNTHARRKFVEVADDFPDECLYVIGEVFGKIYQVDAEARVQNLDADRRLSYHRQKSGPIMDRFAAWMEDQFEQKRVEPNSNLGKAIGYVQQHWNPLTRFLHEPGAPLDNNLCERALKMTIVHRKNSLFYKTEPGAKIGDLFMSLIHTCQLAGENPYHYLTQLQIHSAEVAQDPQSWLPWNYKETLSSPQLLYT